MSFLCMVSFLVCGLQGVAIKFNANQRYATTAITAAILREIARIEQCPLQVPLSYQREWKYSLQEYIYCQFLVLYYEKFEQLPITFIHDMKF